MRLMMKIGARSVVTMKTRIPSKRPLMPMMKTKTTQITSVTLETLVVSLMSKMKSKRRKMTTISAHLMSQ